MPPVDNPPMQNYPSYLDKNSNGFLHDLIISHDVLQEFITIEANYSIQAYHLSLFHIFGIDLPKQLARAVPKRQSEFLAGRILVRTALYNLEHPFAEMVIAIGKHGSPIWPKGVSGSISHSHGKCVCLVTRGEKKLLGIDIEKIAYGSDFDAILQEALSADEKIFILRQTKFPLHTLATLIFSAKETLFKALYPIVNDYFDFYAAKIIKISDNRILSFMLTRPLHQKLPQNRLFLVHFSIQDNFVQTWMICKEDMN